MVSGYSLFRRIIFLVLFSVQNASTKTSNKVTGDTGLSLHLEYSDVFVQPESPLAISTEDPRLGPNAIFNPVSSCMSDVILVVYIQRLDLLERLDVYKDMYSPFFAEIEFYVDGTWCDPLADGNDFQMPCYGPSLDRSTLPEEVHVVDNNGGGWLMQRSLIDAVQRPRESGNHEGFFFMTDDVLLNIGQLTRAAHVSGCDVIWRSARVDCQDISRTKHIIHMVRLFLPEARSFSEFSDKGFKKQLTRNLGSPSTYCMGVQNDFLYIPSGMATTWANIAQQMTDLGLVFTFAFYTAIFGVAPMEDMVVLRTHYLDKEKRADVLLEGATFEDENHPCWTGTGDVSELLGMHIIHPNKISTSEKSWDFALTVNPPGATVNAPMFSVDTSHGDTAWPTVQSNAASAFWCGK